MTEVPNGGQLPSDNLVEQTLERAASKLAENPVVQRHQPGVAGGEALTRPESLLAVAVLLLLNITALFLSFSTRSDIREHSKDFRTVCQLIVESSPPEKAQDMARVLAECLN